ncbi:MAG: hypothetical protein LC808_44270, partial [Actinobacteria bacterium]|nr:hypothetical protein [Actinomycetota bacterium]
MFPPSTCTLADICGAEQVDPSDPALQRIGIESVHAADGQSGSDLALAAAERALAAAGITGKDIDVIVDYTVLPQEYLVPVWNLGNKLQHQLGATKAFALGFSGGGSTNLLVALRFATDLIRANDNVRTALLFGAEIAIPGNRVLNPTQPVTVLGDGASAVVLVAGGDGIVVLGTEIASDATYHDVCYIPGGAL